MEERIGGNYRRALQKTTNARAIGKAKVKRFLEHLAATCNVTASAREAGANQKTFYAMRKRDAAFAAAWKEAMDAGYDRLEEALLAKALADVTPTEFDATAVETVLVDGPPPAPGGRGGLRAAAGLSSKVAVVEVQLALTLLNRRQTADKAGRERSGRRRATAEEVEKAINAKLDSLAARLDQQLG